MKIRENQVSSMLNGVVFAAIHASDSASALAAEIFAAVRATREMAISRTTSL